MDDFEMTYHYLELCVQPPYYIVITDVVCRLITPQKMEPSENERPYKLEVDTRLEMA